MLHHEYYANILTMVLWKVHSPLKLCHCCIYVIIVLLFTVFKAVGSSQSLCTIVLNINYLQILITTSFHNCC
jgi:hypothetical protein